jgi:sodium transport system permease protein
MTAAPRPMWHLQALAVADKEMRDAVRDRRSLASAIVYPLLMPLLIAVMFSFITESLSGDRALELKVSGAAHAPHLVAYLEEHGATVEAWDGDAEQAVVDKDIELALVVSDDFSENLASGKPAVVELVYDGSLKDASPLVHRTQALIQAYSGTLATLRVLARGLDPVVLSVEQFNGVTGTPLLGSLHRML